MNISSTKILEARARNGAAAEERPSYVSDALSPDIRLGFRQGRPIVEPPSGRDDSLTLGDSDNYSHYIRRDELLKPQAGAFLSELFNSDLIESVEAAAEELQTDEETVRKAANLHGIDIPEPPADGAGDSKQLKELQLPSGESIPIAVLENPPWKDKLVLTQLLATDGLSTAEAARYLSRELDSNPTEADIRRAAENCQLLSDDSADRLADRFDGDIEERTHVDSDVSVPESSAKTDDETTSGGTTAASPWE